jgi:hypothetical protein
MAEYLDPIIVSVAVMDRDRLEQTRAECLPLVRLLRNRFWRLWLRNRFGYVSVFGFYLLLVGGAIRLWIGNSHSLSIWSLLIAGAISLLITWFFISHTALNTFLHRWEREEKFIKKELDKHRYTLDAIRRRHRQLNTMTGQ